MSTSKDAKECVAGFMDWFLAKMPQPHPDPEAQSIIEEMKSDNEKLKREIALR